MLHVARFVHPAPLPARSYWAVYDDETGAPRIVFSLGDQNVLVEHPMGMEEALIFHTWLAEAVRALDWPQFSIAATYFVAPAATPEAAPEPPKPAPKKPKPRRRKPPSTARFLARRS